MKHLITSLISGAIVSSAILLGSSALAAEKLKLQTSSKPISLPGIGIGHLKKNPLPDFFIVALTNKHTSGPKAIIRQGSCKNDLRVVLRNLGAEYTYGDMLTSNSAKPKTVKGGQVLVHLQKFQGNELKGYHTEFINHMDKNEVINVDFIGTNAGHFPFVGSYTIKATVIPCAHGASTTNCKWFPEEKTNNNRRSTTYTVSSACP